MNVLLYIMDCLRADRVGCCGYSKNITPNLDRFAKDAILFGNAHAQSTWTYPSGASILSGIYPSSLGIQSIRDPIPRNIPWLPKEFQNNGYVTACFSANVLISETFGFRRGFDVFVDQISSSNLSRYSLPIVILSQHREVLERYVSLSDLVVVTSDDLHRAFGTFAEQRLNEQIFAVIWSVDTHDPYFDRSHLGVCIPDPLYYQPDIVRMWEPEKLAELSGIYDRMLQYNDRTFGELIYILKRIGLYDETIIIVTGDHGEAFGEHGIMTHAGRPFEVQTHVPLLIKLPHSKLGGSRRAEVVELIDVFPTLRDYLHLEEEYGEYLQGKSLVSSRSGNSSIALSEGAGYLSLRTNRLRYIRPQHIDIRRRYRWPLIWSFRHLTQTALYDLVRDPDEKRNISRQYFPWHMWLARKAHSMCRRNQQIRKNMVFDSPVTEVGELVKGRLKAMGYID